MGMAKRLLEEHEAKLSAALRIAIDAGALKVCEYHDDCIFDGGVEIENAYKLGNARFSSGKLDGVFETRREMTDCIKEVVEDNYLAEECPLCAKFLEE